MMEFKNLMRISFVVAARCIAPYGLLPDYFYKVHNRGPTTFLPSKSRVSEHDAPLVKTFGRECRFPKDVTGAVNGDGSAMRVVRSLLVRIVLNQMRKPFQVLLYYQFLLFRQHLRLLQQQVQS